MVERENQPSTEKDTRNQLMRKIAEIKPNQIIFWQAQMGAIEIMTAKEAHAIALKHGCTRNTIEGFRQLFLGGRDRRTFGKITIVRVKIGKYAIEPAAD